MRGIKSFFVLTILVVSLFASQCYFHKWDGNSILYGGDHWGYYSYLPAVFIHHDLDNLKLSLTARNHENWNQSFDTTKPLLVSELSYPKDGRTPVIKYTYGVAVLQFPFFYIAHLLTPYFNYVANGYTKIYFIGLQLSVLFYCFLGFWFLHKTLLRYFSPLAVTVTLFAIGFGTNLYFFLVATQPMAHVYLFFLFSLLMFSVIRFYESKAWAYAIIIGICSGLIAVIRPNEILCLIIPLFYGVKAMPDLKNRLALLHVEWKKFLLSVFFFLIPVAILIAYWKTMSGHWLYYSYPGEEFSFFHAHIVEGLFGFSNGWLAYTPIMYLAIIGILFVYFRVKEWRIPLLVFVPLHVYIIYSWWCWNYINGFGSRPMVEMYALLSIPFAAFLEYSFSKKYLRIGIMIVLLFFVSVNIFQTWQAYNNMLVSELGNFVFIKNTLFKTALSQKDLVEFDCNIEQPFGLQKTKDVMDYNFEHSINSYYVSVPNHGSNYAYTIDGSEPFLFGYSNSLSALSLGKGDWLKISLWCKPLGGGGIYDCSNFIVMFKRNGNAYFNKAIRLENKVLDKKTIHPWGNPGEGLLSFFIPIPNNFEKNDSLLLFLSVGKIPLLVDDVKVEVWR